MHSPILYDYLSHLSKNSHISHFSNGFNEWYVDGEGFHLLRKFLLALIDLAMLKMDTEEANDMA